MRHLALAALIIGLSGPSAAACALELIFAVDVSGSIDEEEWQLQSEGMAAAFEDPVVIDAVSSQPGGILVTYTQWSGVVQQTQVTGWHRVSDGPSARAFAEAIRGAERAWSLFSTAIGQALVHAREVSNSAPDDCMRRVIDISGDGYSNDGPYPGPTADALAAEGYTVNGLVIQGVEPDPAPFYELEVIAGDNAFVELAADFEDFARAFRRKLLREIGTDLVVGQLE